MANNANINVSASGLNEILASLIEMQKAMKSVTEAAKKMQAQINTPTNPNGGGSGASGNGNNSSAGNSAAAERLRRESNSSTRVLTDNARRESMAFVSAYAEIASSVFALTAAFNALKSAAQFGVMLTAQDNFARATGVNLQSIAKGLQATTKYVLDFQQAAQFSSIGRLAGFTTNQITQLAKTGTSAATILGRDVPEALSRMFRGVAKGEPEILDELGIFIRLDNAYKEYIKTVAKGQKVLDLSAYQRRQATLYAAIEAGKPMAEGNANAKIDDFTIAAAQISTAFKTAMLNVTNILGPVVKFLTENTSLLVATIALLGSKVMSNLGNILFNVTAAKTAQAAIASKQTENRAGIQTNKDKFTTASTLATAQANQGMAKEANRIAGQQLITSYKQLQLERLQQKVADGRLTAAKALSIYNKLNANIQNDASGRNVAARSASAQLPAGAHGPMPGVTAAQQALNNAAQQAAIANTQALATANRLVAIEAARASAIATSGWGKFGAVVNIATGYVRVFTLSVMAAGAALKTAFMAGITALGSIIGAFSILFIAYQGGKALLNWIGVFGKGISDAESAMKSAAIQSKKTMEAFNKLGKKPILDPAGALASAKIYSSTFDSITADLNNVIDKLKEVKEAGAFGKLDIELALPTLNNANKLLNSDAKKRIMERVTDSMNNERAVAYVNYDDKSLVNGKFGAGLKLMEVTGGNYDLATSSMEGLSKAIENGTVPAKVLKALMEATAIETGKGGENAAAWAASIEGVSNATANLRKEFAGITGTLKDESIFNSILDKALQARNEVKQLALAFTKETYTVKVTTQNEGRVRSEVESAIVKINEINEILKVKPFKLNPDDNLSKQISLTYVAMKQAENGLNSYVGSIEKYRTLDINSSKELNNKVTGLQALSRQYSVLGVDTSVVTTALEKLYTVQANMKSIRSKKGFVEENKGALGEESNNNQGTALSDAQKKLRLLAKDEKNISQEFIDNINGISIFRDGLHIPITLATDAEMQDILDKLKDMPGVTKELKAKVKLILLGKPAFDQAVAASTVALKGYDDIIAETKNLNEDLVPSSLLTGLKAYTDLTVLNTEDQAKLTKATNDYVAALAKKYNAIIQNGKAYSLEGEMLGIVNEEMISSTINSQKSASELSNIFSGMSVDVAAKIAEMEGKLKTAAVANATKTVEALVVELKKGDLPTTTVLDKDQLAYMETFAELNALQKAGTLTDEKSIQLNAKLAILNNSMLDTAQKEALLKAKDIHLTQEQIKAQTQLMKEDKWRDLMIESAKEVTSAWQDVKDTIARGMGKDGSSLSDSIKGALGKGKSGILDAITGKISQKQDSAFSTLESKAKNFFLGSKDDKGNKLPGALSKLGDKITTAFPSVGKAAGFLGDLGGLDLLKGVLSKNESQRNASIGGALGSVAGKSIGMAFGSIGGPLGMAVGSVLGNIIGSTFGKKLKETGVLTKVSELGIVSANSIQIFKKTGLSGTRTIEQVGNSLEAEAISALQNAVTNTRKSYEANILSFNAMTKDVFQLTIGGMTKAFSAKYLQAAGGGKSESDLLKDFIKDYGNFLGSEQLGFLNQFKDVTESLTDVLARLVNTIKVTDTAFKSAFGKGISMIGDLTKSYSGNFLKTQAKGLVDGLIQQLNMVQGTYGAVYKDANGLDMRVGITEQLNKLIANTLVTPKGETANGTIIKGFSGAKPVYADSGTPNGSINLGTNTPNGVKPLPTSYLTDYFEKMNEFEKANSTGFTFFSKEGKETLNTLTLIEKFIRGTITPSEKIYLAALAAQDFTDRIVKAFDGENIAAKKEAYNKAMFGYTNMVSNTISVTSGQVASLITDMSRVNDTILPPGLKAVKDGLLVPVQEFNNEMRKAVENGVSPEKIAEGIKLGSKLSEVISGVLETFSSISLADLKNASDFSTSVSSAITDTFKTSATDSFKKSLLAPLLVDMTASIDKASVGDSSGFVASMKNYALSGDIVANQAKNMVQVLSDQAFKSAMDSVSIEFEKLMKVFDSANSSEIMSSLSKAILDIEKTLKESAYSFAVSGDAYSVALFKAKEAFKAAGLSSDYATQPIGSVVAKMKQLASTGLITTTNIDAVNDALNAMADASIAARDQIQATVEASASSMDAANNFISSLTNSIITDSDSMSAAKTALTGLLTVASDKVDKARAEYAKARASGNLLAANQAAENLTSSLESYVNQEIEVNNTLKSMAEDRYNTEKAALDNLKTIISDIANFIKELKFDDKLSILKPIDRLNEASKDFEATKAKVLADAASGKLTPEAIKNLQDDSKRLLDLGRDAYASSDAYTALYNSVTAAMGVVNGRAEADVLTYEASTKMYQDMALSFAKDTRDIQVDALTQLKILTKASAVDNAIAVDMINALKYNKELGGSVTLSDYYKELFKDAQGGGTIFTQPEIGYSEFQGTGTYDDTNKAMQEANNAKLNQVLDTLTTVLQNLPVNVKSAIQSTATPTTNRN